jgi:lipopolysaccharide transport system ATP-binding protein
MSSDNFSVKVEALGKCYHIYERPQDRLKQSILPRIRNILGREFRSYYREFWALKAVSFQIARGETVGIIGRNGCGKSTLLQMICGTLEPTTGTVETIGRIAALLELGAGFNPEFTGRENVYMNAAVLGLTEKEIRERFDEIATFADIGDFIDQPVKHYSSGMYARLAFAVAINVDPDILVVDEALAVGDEPFQRKCFARLERIRNDGGTILFVSHSGSTIINLCDRAILLHQGSQIYTGIPKRAVFFSQKLGNSLETDPVDVLLEIERANIADHDKIPLADSSEVRESETGAAPTGVGAAAQDFFDKHFTSQSVSRYEENGAEISHQLLTTSDNISVNQIVRGRKYQLQCDVSFYQQCPNVRVYVLIRTTSGVEIAGCAYPKIGEPGLDYGAGETLRFQFPFTCCLNPASYFCSFAVQANDGSLHHRIVDAIAFRVMADHANFATGIVDVGFEPNASRINTP